MEKYLDKPARYPRREFKHPDPGTTFCRQCNAVHEEKRWRWDSERQFEMSSDSGIKPITCPACHMEEQGLYDGQLVIEWPKLARDPKQKEQILSLLRHEEAEEKDANPLSKICSIKESGSEIEVHTTTEFLVNKLGHALHSAYSGELKIDPLKYEDFTRVTWSRD